MASLLEKQSVINNGLNVSEHMYIKYDAYAFHVSFQCSIHLLN